MVHFYLNFPAPGNAWCKDALYCTCILANLLIELSSLSSVNLLEKTGNALLFVCTDPAACTH